MANFDILLNHLSQMGRMRQADKYNRSNPASIVSAMTALSDLNLKNKLAPLEMMAKMAGIDQSRAQTGLFETQGETAKFQLGQQQGDVKAFETFLNALKGAKGVRTKAFEKAVKEGVAVDAPHVQNIYEVYETVPEAREFMIKNEDMLRTLGILSPQGQANRMTMEKEIYKH